MRIGHNDNSLHIEKVGHTPSLIWRFEATALGVGWMFAGLYERVVVNTSSETSKALEDFAEGRSHRLEIELSEAGWFRVKRDARGCILIRYRVGRLQAGAALEGEIALEAEPANAFCRELRTLL